MKWLFQQLDGPVDVDIRDRDDVSVIEVPQDTVGYITGARRMAMISMEAEWGVFMFFSDFKDQKDREKDNRRKTERSLPAQWIASEMHYSRVRLSFRSASRLNVEFIYRFQIRCIIDVRIVLISRLYPILIQS